MAKKDTVKRRIFRSNAWMVLIILLLFFAINMLVIKIYAESVETEFQNMIEPVVEEEQLKDYVKDFTLRKHQFVLLFAADGGLCIVALILVSQFFTRQLTSHIMEPLDALSEGVKRIRDNDLSQNVIYTGETEFEEVCGAFNEMQQHILQEQEKNRRYEKARTDMIAGISHDLRTPLTAVRGTIKGLLDGIAATPEQQNKFLQAAYRRSGDMDVLLNQLFYLSKVETGNMPVSLQPVDLCSFLQQYVSAKQELSDPAQEQIRLDAEATAVQVQIDPEQFQRILDNLLENSRKYAEQTPLQIVLSLKMQGNMVCLDVKDNGVGVPEDKLPYIFDEFYRADESRNKKEGNGLGLYIVRHLMEAMDGTVSAENADGFVLHLMLPADEPEEGGGSHGTEKDSDRGR